MVSAADGLQFFPPTITSFQFLADLLETVRRLLDMLPVDPAGNKPGPGAIIAIIREYYFLTRFSASTHRPPNILIYSAHYR